MRKSALIIVLILVLSLIPAWAIKPVAAVDNTLPAIDDAYSYYYNGETFNWRNSSYDSYYEDYVLYVGNSSKYRMERAYLKFNLSALSADAQIQSASLCIYVTYVKNGPFEVGLYTTTSNWNGSETPEVVPEPGELLATLSLSDYNTEYCFDISEFMASLDFTVNKTVSFLLKLVDESLTYNYVKISSTDASSNRPYIRVIYTEEETVPQVSIQEIQSNTTDGDASAYDGQQVATEGVVTAVTSRGFFIQNGTGPWSGIYVYLGSTPDVSQGDYVRVVGTVDEYYGMTELKVAPENVTVLGTAEVPDPVVLQTGEVAQEQWEGVLVKVENVAVTNPDLGYGEWEIDDGSGPVRVDDLMYRYTPQEGQSLDYVVGVVYYSYGNFKIEPRGEGDIGIPPEIPVLSIQEIQSNTTDGDSSAYKGRVVTTEGVVTYVASNGFELQNGTGPWSGIWVYTGFTPQVEIGNYIRITARVDEYYNLTELNYKSTDPEVRSIEVLGSGEVPEPETLSVSEASQEKWEGVLIKLVNVKVSGGYITDKTGGIVLYDRFSTGIGAGEYYHITGIVSQFKGTYEFWPIEAEVNKFAKIRGIASLSNALTAYYDAKFTSMMPSLEESYSKMQALVSNLTACGVDLGDAKEYVDRINENMERIDKERQMYLTVKSLVGDSTLGGGGYYYYKILTMTYSRHLVHLARDASEELDFILPILQKTYEQIEPICHPPVPAPGNETMPGNETPSNETNETPVTPTPNVTIQITKVLIDAAHGQYYVNKVGVTYLINEIKTELGWEVELGQVPLIYDNIKDYDVVIVLNPKDDFTEAEVEGIQQYVEKGGGLFIAGEWYKYLNLESLNALVREYGIAFNADELMDEEKNSGRPYYPFIGIYNKDHPAMKFVPDDWTMYYNGDTLTISGDAVWLIRGYETSYSVDADGNVVCAKGSKPIVAAALEVGNGRIVAYGSSKALSDDYYQKYIKSNWPFVKGVLLWLAHHE